MADVKNDVCESSFGALADELIDIILSYDLLDHHDLCRFAQTCLRFKEIAYYPELWKKKALRRWKRWKNQVKDHWKIIYQNRYKVEKEILAILDRLSIQYGAKADVSRSQYKSLTYLTSESPYADYFECTLEEIINGNPEIPRDSNLTHRYYAEKMYDYAQKLVLKKEWGSLMNKPVEEQHLEVGAMIIAKWIDNKNTGDHAKEAFAMLDEMANRVRNIVQEEVPAQDCSSPSDPRQCMQILEGIKHVMYNEEKFNGNTQDYYNVNNSLITQVLKTKQGIPISLAVIFVAVARRLGVHVEPVNSPNHFLIRWCSSQDSEMEDLSDSYTYIDAFDEGKFYSQEQCANRFISGIASLMPTKTLFPQALPRDVFIRMVTNIANIYRTSVRMNNGLLVFRNALELLTLVKPNDSGYKLLIAQVDVHLDINLDEAIGMLQEILILGHDITVTKNLIEHAQKQKHQEEQEQRKPVKQKLRSDETNDLVNYRIGMVMRHRRYHYGCVIYGWDYFCDMDESWIMRMGVDRLPLGRSQPFYNVLGDDGSSRYAAQENLLEEPNQPFNPHPEIGKYFKWWTGSQYIPNEYLAQKYPEDCQQDN